MQYRVRVLVMIESKGVCDDDFTDDFSVTDYTRQTIKYLDEPYTEDLSDYQAQVAALDMLVRQYKTLNEHITPPPGFSKPVLNTDLCHVFMIPEVLDTFRKFTGAPDVDLRPGSDKS